MLLSFGEISEKRQDLETVTACYLMLTFVIAFPVLYHTINTRCDVILLDTSGRHQQEESLFEEMKEIDAVVGATNTYF